MKLTTNKYISFNSSIVNIVSKIDLNGTNYVPQGICFAEGYYFLSMYDFLKKNNSVIWVFKNGKIIKKITLNNKNHCGGISYNKDLKCIFISGKGEKNHSYVEKYDISYLLSEFNDDYSKSNEIFEVDNNNSLYSSSAKHSSPSFLTCFDNYLFVGNYCDINDIDKCFIKRFKIFKDGSLSSNFDILKNPFSNTQSICVFENKNEIFYLFSRSFGRKYNSLIHICKLVNGNFKVISTMVLPSMLEQVSYCEGNLVLIFESASSLFKKDAISYNDGIYLIDLEKVLICSDNYKDFCRGTSLFNKNFKYKY